MDEKQLQALANELAKNLKTPEDLSQFDRLLKKLRVEAALNAEMTHHLGYEKNQSRPGANSRNGFSTKTVITGDGPLEQVVWLAIQSASQKWTMPLKDWRMAMSRFIIEFGDRLDGHF